MNTPDIELRQEAEEVASYMTEQEHIRIESYRNLRWDFGVTTVDAWLNAYWREHESVFKPEKDPTWNEIRKDAGIGFLENMVSVFSSSKKKDIVAKKDKSRRKLQLEVDEANKRKQKRCDRANNRLKANISDKLTRFTACDEGEVEEYFCYALKQDLYMLDGIECTPNFNLLYIPEEKRLVVDYELPLMEDIPRTKEWKADKNNEIVPKNMNKSDYFEMYERIIFDISVRTVGILFDSDNMNVLNEIIFNGSCVYRDWQEMPTIILSFIIAKNRYSFERVQSMDFISKAEIAKLENVRYLGDIHSEKAPADLWETPPSKLITPFQSSFR